MARGGRRPGSGRKPKPDYLKLLENNPGKRHVGAEKQTESAAADGGATKIRRPAWLDHGARRVWRVLEPALDAAGALESTDADALGLLCATYSRWQAVDSVVVDMEALAHGIAELVKAADPGRREDLEKQLDAFFRLQEGHYGKLEDKYWGRLRWLLTEFGMTPSSRARIDSSGSGGGEKGDPLDAWLKKGRKK